MTSQRAAAPLAASDAAAAEPALDVPPGTYVNLAVAYVDRADGPDGYVSVKTELTVDAGGGWRVRAVRLGADDELEVLFEEVGSDSVPTRVALGALLALAPAAD